MYLFQGNKLLVPQSKTKPETLSINPTKLHLIPSLAGGALIEVADISLDQPVPPEWTAVPVRRFVEGAPDGAELFRAFHIVQWYRDSVFCGRCGNRNEDAVDELARLCPHCGQLEFPRIAPAIIVLVSNGAGQIVLAHNKKFNTGIFSLIAGFNEAGETLEETVVREVREEVALDVRDVRYVSSQPWPFPHSLMIGFTAQYAGGSLQADGVEIEEARWFDRKHLAAPDMLPGRASVARQLIERWIAGQLP